MKTRRRRRNASEWQEIISNQEIRGESVSAYCQKQSLCKKSFYAWRNRLRAKATLPNGFIELKAPQVLPLVQATIRVTSPQGYVVEIPAGIEAVSIKNVFEAMEKEC